MARRTSRQLAAVVLALLLVTTACSGGPGSGDEDTVLIGISLPLTGERSQPGKASEQGYRVWEQWVNEEGGILGQPVELVVRDDASDPNRTRTNYQSLIDRDRVDLLLGTFSTLLNLPASAVAEQRKKLFVCPSCGSPEELKRNFHFTFFSQPAVIAKQGDLFAEWVTSLPPDQRPKTAAYPTLDDNFTIPVVEGIREQLEAAGIRTVYAGDPYPEGLSDFSPIAGEIKASGAELVAQGSIFPDAVGLIRAMQQVGYNPEVLFQTTAPSTGQEYADAVKPDNTTGVFYAVSWSPAASYPMNQEFVERHRQMFDSEPTEDAADSFAAAQVTQAAVEAVGEIPEDQTPLADWLHANEVETILGPLTWDARGAPQGEMILAQWQRGESRVVLPTEVANSDEIVFPKPDWGAAAGG